MSDETTATRIPMRADEIAARLGLHRPTDEQRSVIEADPLGRSLVVAGAGSGKTETMSNRVVWLLANGHVHVPEVLGLTFTRKAAGELAERVRDRVAQLAGLGLAATHVDPLESASVGTYNAFASGIYREHAMLIGREPDAAVLGEASAWQLARSVTARSTDARLLEIDASLEKTTGAVLDLSRALAENVADPRDVHVFARDFLAMSDLPFGKPRQRVPAREFVSALGIVDALPPLLDLAEQFAQAKRARGYVEFSDQIALALQICTTHPEVVDAHRERYRAVLLDEYQDTSVVQTRLLATLFRGQSVMAVGDPDQSIYGWRGASAANLARFGGDFAGGGEADPTAGDNSLAVGTTADAVADAGVRAAAVSTAVYGLSTSWRNPRLVLDAANAVIAPLDSGVDKAALAPSPFARAGSLTVEWAETIDDEASLVAEWFAHRLHTDESNAGDARSGALLCRTFANVGIFVDALSARGVPVHVLGVAGLLDQPVIADLVCTLRVLHDPSAGAELIRVLGGARWRIGPADLAALRRLASWLAERDTANQRLDDDVRAGLRASIAADESPSIVDALDFLLTAPDTHRALAAFSEIGLARMRRAGAELQSLRRRGGLGLIDLVNLVQHTLLLDIEIAANENQRLGGPSLEAFDELLQNFIDLAEYPTLGAFLTWLTEAEQRDRLSPRHDDPEPGAVQVLSIHGSKGLEWDAVAIPRFVADELPAKPRSTKGWLSFGSLPFEFRGDATELPELHWRGVADQHEFCDSLAAFGDENRARHAEEERRLAYVALTRTRSELLVTGSWWATQKKPRHPSPFLRELVQSGVVAHDALPTAPASDENPRIDDGERQRWPLDPLGPRHIAVHAAAHAVRHAAEVPSGAGIGPQLRDQIDMLLEERRRRASPAVAAEIPVRVPASRFKDYVDDAQAVADEIARPMPQRPYRATRLGTLFHSWVEHRSARGANDIDALETDLDYLGERGGAVDDPTPERLRVLQARFEASDWGARRPSAVELELHLPMAGNVFVCKLDAVYDIEPGSALAHEGFTHQVVDWKTGKAPRTERDLELKQTQLALYRLAYARFSGVAAEQIDAVFYFVEDDRVIRPDRLYDEVELRRVWGSVSSSAAASPADDELSSSEPVAPVSPELAPLDD